MVTARGRASSPFAFVVSNDPRVPDEVGYKAGYVNPVPRPRDFKSALLWGIAIADTRVPGYESAEVEIDSTQLTCRVESRDVILNDDSGNVRGGSLSPGAVVRHRSTRPHARDSYTERVGPGFRRGPDARS